VRGKFYTRFWSASGAQGGAACIVVVRFHIGRLRAAGVAGTAVIMATFLITAAVIMLTLGLVSYISGKRVDDPPSGAPMLSLLPGDIKYESPSGNFRFYFPITTSIVISIVLTLVLWLFL
jgi:Protein of unknown function (DUF2905)